MQLNIGERMCVIPNGQSICFVHLGFQAGFTLLPCTHTYVCLLATRRKHVCEAYDIRTLEIDK